MSNPRKKVIVKIDPPVIIIIDQTNPKQSKHVFTPEGEGWYSKGSLIPNKGDDRLFETINQGFINHRKNPRMAENFWEYFFSLNVRKDKVYYDVEFIAEDKSSDLTVKFVAAARVGVIWKEVFDELTIINPDATYQKSTRYTNICS